jgi:AraC family transcriptional regulator of arabinose operon
MQKLLSGDGHPPTTGMDDRQILVTGQRVDRYEVPSKSQLRLGLWVTSVGFHIALPPHRLVRDRAHESFAAVFISKVDGHGFFESALAGRHAITTGALLWIVPGVRHSYAPLEGTWDEHWVVFGGSMADELLRQGFLSASRPPMAVGPHPEISGIFARLEEAFIAGGPLAGPLAASLAHQLIIQAHGLATGLLRMDQHLDPVIARTLHLIDQEFVRGLSPFGLARRVGVGYSTLRRRFKSQTGFSIKEYTLRLQLRRAKELLAGTGTRIADVAAAVGMDNPLYFSRLFTQRVGVSPTLFRQRSGVPEPG